MTTKDEALKMALEALENLQGLCTDADDGWVEAVTIWTPEAISAIREALAEQPAQQQEPVAWKDEQGNVRMTLDFGEIQSSVGYVYSVHGEHIKNACIRSDIPNGTPLYTSPPASKLWVGLTDEEYSQLHNGLYQQGKSLGWVVDQAEAKLREKNT